MGRRISKDKPRNKKNKIIIAVEGKNKTEKIYFDNFDDGKKNYSITIARGNDTDPIKLVRNLEKEMRKREISLKNGDKVFCVFDVDIDYKKNKVIEEAKEFASKNGIQIITSTPCVELWFLLHYDYTTAPLTNNEVMKRLKKYYPKYEKNINIYMDINSKTSKAIENAKKLEIYQKENNRIIGTVEANPNTEIYKIVEYLLSNSF